MCGRVAARPWSIGGWLADKGSLPPRGATSPFLVTAWGFEVLRGGRVRRIILTRTKSDTVGLG